MKTLTTLVFCLVTMFGVAQTNGINYKALIKDTNGNVVNNTSTTIEFTVYKGIGLFNTYRETHTIFTDANGILITNIGEGTIVNGIFNDIDWSNDEYFLGVKIDTGAGNVDLGITAFKTVPYAIQATKATIAETALNANGLERIDEGNGFGWRLKFRNEFYYGNIGENAVDFSYNNTSSDTHGATGEYAFATGYQTTASGGLSSTFGYKTTASGSYSTALGSNTVASESNSIAFGSSTEASGINAAALGSGTIASGVNATAFGSGTTASGNQATAFGRYTSAPSFSEFTTGTFNTIYTPMSTSFFNASDRIFVVGNGESTARSDALIIKKDGSITAPSLDISKITNDKSLITKEYAETHITSGIEAITESSNTGWRLIGQNSLHYGTIGQKAVDFSISTTNSTTRGATGNWSFALGNLATAEGDYSFAGGSSSNAIANSSTALGLGTKAQAYFSSAFGMYNIGLGNSTSYINTDPILEIGNGYSNDNRSNALTILKNGKVGIDTAIPNTKLHITGGSNISQLVDNSGFMIIGDINNFNVVFDDNEIMARENGSDSPLTLQKHGGNLAVGHIAPDAKLHVSGGNDASLANGSGYVVIGDLTNQNMVIDQNEIIARNNGAGSTLHLQYDGGNVAVGGNIVHSSDRRLKREISDLEYGLKEVLQMQPKQYFWKNRDKQKQESLGVIAQEMQRIIPNVVVENDNEQKTLSVSYTELIPVLINAIKEQQKIIENQNINYANLLKRVEVLENNTPDGNALKVAVEEEKK